MGLYGDILRAVDGSIFTFDKIVDFASLGLNIKSSTEQEIDAAINALADIDSIFLGRFILLTEKLWVYVKTHDGKKYTYTKIAKLHSLNDLDETHTDEWINIDDKNNENNPFLYHEIAGPKVLVYPEEGEAYLVSNENYQSYKDAQGISIEGIGLQYSYYDRKGHLFKTEMIGENPSEYSNDTYTLILNGGHYLND